MLESKMMKAFDKPLTNREFKSIYSKVVRLTVDLIIKSQSGILLTLRSIPPQVGYWHFPGGTVLLGESLSDAVKRIAQKELGLEVTSMKLLRPLEYRNSESVIGHCVSLVYLVQTKGQIELNDEASEYGYFSKPPLNSLKEVKQLMRERI